jgi:hypothetical protein
MATAKMRVIAMATTWAMAMVMRVQCASLFATHVVPWKPCHDMLIHRI